MPGVGAVVDFLRASYVDEKRFLGAFVRAGIAEARQLDGLARFSDARIDAFLDAIAAELHEVTVFERAMIKEGLSLRRPVLG